MLYLPRIEELIVGGPKFPVFHQESNEDFYAFITRMHKVLTCKYDAVEFWLEDQPENAQILWTSILQLLEISKRVVVPEHNVYEKDSAGDLDRYNFEPLGHWYARLLGYLPSKVSANIHALFEYDRANRKYYIPMILGDLNNIIKEIKQAEEQ
jgi:hypothetical protein